MRSLLAGLVLILGTACQPARDSAPGPAEAAAAPQPPDSITAGFRCGEFLADALFDNARGELVLTVGTRRLVLPQAVAASGARYADADGNEFWNKGDRASFSLDGRHYDCVADDDARSHWDRARQRGLVFRGLGTEPYWSLDVYGEPEPRIELDLDMGERKLLVRRPEALADGEGYSGHADDASPVVLRIARGACSDGMSDEVYPASIELSVGGRGYRGCGVFLQD